MPKVIDLSTREKFILGRVEGRSCRQLARELSICHATAIKFNKMYRERINQLREARLAGLSFDPAGQKDVLTRVTEMVACELSRRDLSTEPTGNLLTILQRNLSLLERMHRSQEEDDDIGKLLVELGLGKSQETKEEESRAHE